ncbi:MAG: tRNA (guanosine(46)-N7)-methyltransferase TrmB [Arcanobacterium sp.]|nr:tRNA (guanosine(46)-N7)-methyltransferase TrmB [Arcanobacterium sp.]
MRPIRSFSLRGQRLSESASRMMARYGHHYVIDVPQGEGVVTAASDATLDFDAIYGRNAPLVVEVGPGSGEQIVASAERHPDVNYLALEAWEPGVAKCVSNIVRSGVDNVRVMNLDAQQALPILFRPGGTRATEVWTFFPDPWRKKKHRKRRLVNPSFARTMAQMLDKGGMWRLATDWDNYAWQMRDVLEESPWFDNPHRGERSDDADTGLYQGGFAPRFAERVVTRFEERGIEAGRVTHDLCVVRNDVALDAYEVPADPWVAAEQRGIHVVADEGGERAPSSRRGWLQLQEAGSASSDNTAHSTGADL